MQTYKEKVAILATVESIDEIEIYLPPDVENGFLPVDGWVKVMFLKDTTIRVKPKTLTRTITTPVPVTLEWSLEHPESLVYAAYHGHITGERACMHAPGIYRAGLIFHTQEEAKAAHDAFVESVK
jgi:hypothetical protein